jgi:putative DNA primase/helicase
MIDMLLCPVVTVRAVGTRYSRQTILHAFPPKEQKSSRRHQKAVAANPRQEVELTDAHRLVAAQTVAEMKSDHPVLWQGKFDQLGARRGGGHYESQSDADLAMAGYIAKQLAERVATREELHLLTVAVMDRSGLAQRPKWHDRPDYRASTIAKACADVEVQPLVDWALSGDVRNAKVFARMYRDKFLYVHQQGKWLQWRNDRWQPCEMDEELAAATEVAKTLVRLAADELGADPDRGKRLVSEAMKAAMLPRLKALLELAAAEPGMGVTPGHLDAQANFLGVKNGVVNLRMGWLQPNQPEFLITKHCAADFDKTAECPRWLQTLDQVFQGDQATIDTFQVLLGLTLTGETGEEVIIFCVGFGANGKSVISNVVTTIMGGYAQTAPPSLLASRRTDDHGPRSDLAMLKGARLVSINELPGGMRLDEVMTKQLAGREPIAARHLYGEFFSFLPSFTPWVRTNHKPIVTGEDDGIWRRIVILPFRRKFEKHEQDPYLESKLLAERDGILRWMIEGAQRYYRDGLRLSPAMKREQATYRKESDLLGEFLEEKTVTDPQERVEQGQMYFDWKLWCEANGVYPGSKKTFTQRMAERGFTSAKSNGKHLYAGLKRRGGLT